MKNLFNVFCFCFPLFLFAQIQNSDFSDWEIVDGFERPVAWKTNQNMYSNNIERVEDGVNSWVKFTSDNYDDQCGGRITQTFEYPELAELVSLDFDIRTKSFEADSSTILRIFVSHVSKDLVTVNTEIFDLDTLISEFIRISIPLQDSLVLDSIFISFTGGSILGPFGGCRFDSEIEIDNIELSVITSTENIDNDFILHPNPVDEVLYIKGLLNRKSRKIKVMDSVGKLMLETKYNSGIDLSPLPPGLYYVLIEGGLTEKIVVY